MNEANKARWSKSSKASDKNMSLYKKTNRRRSFEMEIFFINFR